MVQLRKPTLAEKKAASAPPKILPEQSHKVPGTLSLNSFRQGAPLSETPTNERIFPPLPVEPESPVYMGQKMYEDPVIQPVPQRTKTYRDSNTTVSNNDSPKSVQLQEKQPKPKPEALIKEPGIYTLKNGRVVAIVDLDPHGSLAYDATGQAWSMNGLFVLSSSREYDVAKYLCCLPPPLDIS